MRLRPWRKPALRPEPLARAVVVGDLLRTTLERDGVCTWRARGSSMWGSVADGTVVTLRPVPAWGIDRGDVVMAELDDDRLVLHRVEDPTDDRFILQGNALRRPAPPVGVDRVIAVMDAPPHRPLRSIARRWLP